MTTPCVKRWAILFLCRGFQVECAESGGDALKRLQCRDFSLVVSDVQMEGVDGHQLLRQIKSQRADLPVVLMTAYGSIEKAVAAMRNGASDYLVKPFEAEVLIQMVSRFIGQVDHLSGNIVAKDSRTIELTHLAARVASSDATVMISGPSGSGKEIFARLIHDKVSPQGRTLCRHKLCSYSRVHVGVGVVWVRKRCVYRCLPGAGRQI